MILHNLIIYKFKELYHVLEELGFDLNFNILFADNENILNKPIVIHGDSGSGKSTYLKEIIGLTGNEKNNCCSFLIKNSLQEEISILDCKGFYMSQQIFYPQIELKDYLLDFANLNDSELYDLFC